MALRHAIRIGGYAAMLSGGMGLESAAQAGAFYLPQQSVRAAGRAYSGEAADSGPASLWWNPAAIAGTTEANGAVGVIGIFPEANSRDRGSQIVRPGQPAAPVGGNPAPANAAKFGAVPNLSLALPLSERVAFGLAVSAPFGLTTDYDEADYTRYAADRTRLITIDVQPTIAVEVADWLRVGAGLNIEYADALLSIRLPNLTAALPDGRQVLTGDGWDYGWSAGVQFVGQDVTVGLSYKSAIDHDLSGAVEISGLLGPLAASNGRLATTADFNTPWQAIAGLRYRATEKATLNLQVTRFGWSEFDQITLTAPPGARVTENYRNSWVVAGGVDYELSPMWTVRGGAYYDQTPTRNGDRNPSVPDANRVAFALGATRAIGAKASLDASIEYIHFTGSTLDRPTTLYEGTPVATQILTNGRTVNSGALTVGIGGRFSF